MSTICSKIDDIDKLWFEPFPSKPIAALKICRVENVFIAQGANGKIYTNAVQARLAYTGGHEGRLGCVLDGCIKLGILSARAVKQHKEDMAERQRKLDHKWNVAQLQTYVERLGIQLTEKQKAKLASQTNTRPTPHTEEPSNENT